MSRYEATFEIKTKSDAHIVRLLAERVYDTMREERSNSLQNNTDLNKLLQQFAAIREAARNQSPGSLTIIYEQHDESFDD